jgi:hypothetical protein
VAIELNDDLIALRRAADDAHAEVRRLQEEFGKPTQEGGWTDEQHAAWNEALAVWRELAMKVAAAMPSGPDPLEIDRVLKRAARGPASEA